MNNVMIEDYECIMYPNAKVQPEGETACWIYFTVNYWNSSTILPGSDKITYTEYPSLLYLTRLWHETDANGNQIMYSSSGNESAIVQSYFFTPKRRLPFRKLTRKELFKCYKVYHEKRLSDKIVEYEKAVTKEQADYNSLSAAEKKNQSYLVEVMAKTKKILDDYKAEKENMINWYSAVMQQPTINDTAYAEQLVHWKFEPEKLDAAPGKGNPVWIDDISFYDKTKPADQPQVIFFRYRRQDSDLSKINLPKKNFMDKFCNEFNLDILAKMVGLPASKPGGINTINGSINDIKITTKEKQNSKEPFHFTFENTATGTFPADWRGMNNVTVENYNGSKCLAIAKEGYWYPRQYNMEIKDGFSLSLNLQWPKEIPYYSSYFTVTIGEVPYDNAAQNYRMDVIGNRSFYTGYTGNFNRVVLWFDPHWNNGGTLDMYVYNGNETVLMSKKITLPEFYREKNNHLLTIRRIGNGLLVIDNGKTVTDIPNVFVSTLRYNLYTFSKYKENKQGEGGDIFYLNNITATY
jgi:hypothetical protein